jgi:hypothetical protein
MKTNVVYCPYRRQENPLVKKLGDLKTLYATSKSPLIKSLLYQTEQLVIYRVGNVEMIRRRMEDVFNPSQEERCFFEKLKKMLG